MNESPFEASHPEIYSRDLARRINELMGDAELRTRMGKAGRKRAEEIFSWRTIAKQTHSLYEELIAAKSR